ncbi:MAG: thioredoxin [Ruminococcus sp.]|nr:thioredoxin [Ruminococcus sp.]
MISEIYEEEFYTKVIKSPDLVLVDFYADWCTPCKMLSPILNSLQDDFKEYRFYKVNVDNNNHLAKTYKINSIPNIKIFYKGKCIDTVIGIKSKTELTKILIKNIKRRRKSE